MHYLEYDYTGRIDWAKLTYSRNDSRTFITGRVECAGMAGHDKPPMHVVKITQPFEFLLPVYDSNDWRLGSYNMLTTRNKLFCIFTRFIQLYSDNSYNTIDFLVSLSKTRPVLRKSAVGRMSQALLEALDDQNISMLIETKGVAALWSNWTDPRDASRSFRQVWWGTRGVPHNLLTARYFLTITGYLSYIILTELRAVAPGTYLQMSRSTTRHNPGWNPNFLGVWYMMYQ